MTSDPLARYQTLRESRTSLLTRLRPMNAGEVVDTSLRIYQRLGITFLRVSALPALLCLASFAFVDAYVLPGLLYSKDGGSFASHLQQVGLALTLGLFVGGPLFLSGVSYSTCAIVTLVADWYVGNPVDVRAAEATARNSMGRLLLLSMKELLIAFSGVIAATAIIVAGEWLATVTPDSDQWSGVVVAVGLLGLFVGGIIFLAVVAKDGLVAPVTVLENPGLRAATRRGRDLLGKTQYHPSGTASMWGLYARLLFFSIVLLTGIYTSAELIGLDDAIARWTSGMILKPLIDELVGLLPWFFTIWTLLPVWASTITLLYFDRRVRLEGFDIEVLGRDLAQNSYSSRLQL